MKMLMLARNAAVLGAVALGLSACGPGPVMDVDGEPAANLFDDIVPGYETIADGEYVINHVPAAFLQGVNQRAHVPYLGPEAPGTIVVDPHAKFLFLVEEGGMARRYPIAVGRAGLRMSGDSTIGMRREWPGWTPTANMLRTQPDVYGPFAGGIPGGLTSPLGARALYLYQNGRDTHFRIHGTTDNESIGNSGSAGCIRMFNHDVIDLYDRVETGTRVTVRTYEESVRYEGEELASRGIELPPRVVDPETIYGATDVALTLPSELQDALDQHAGPDNAASDNAAPDNRVELIE